MQHVVFKPVGSLQRAAEGVLPSLPCGSRIYKLVNAVLPKMTEALERSIRGALLQYARVRELKEYEEDGGCTKRPAPSENAEDSPATGANKSKMIRVARMLVDSNPRVRNKGMAKIGCFLGSFQELTEDELLRVWSTLYYAAWLSDKPTVQSEFFVRASLLHRRLQSPQAKNHFFRSFFRVLVAEWGKVDKHRTNKFLLFCRIFLAEWMHVMRLLEWDENFVKPAVDFLWEEVMLLSTARGIALHVADIFTDEFRALLHAEQQPASSSQATDTVSRQEKQQKERLHAFSWLFVPLLRCCCFSSDTALVARVHERGLRQLGTEDVNLQFVAAALFALARDERVRSENIKQLYASYEHVKEEADAAGYQEDTLSERRVGRLTGCSFAELIVDRVFSGCRPEQENAKTPYNPIMEFPKPRKRQMTCEWNEVDAEVLPELSCGGGTSGNLRLVPCKKVKRDTERFRLAPEPCHGNERLDGERDTPSKTSQIAVARRAGKEKTRKRQPVSGKSWQNGNGVSSCATAQSGSGPTSVWDQGHVTAASVEAQTGDTPSRWRSLRVSEAHSNIKRVLFNLKKNKVVAFSRHAPSLAVRPASPPLTKSSVRGAMAEASPSPSPGGRPTEALPRSILRAAKVPGPPTSDEVAPLPPIRKLQRPGWWGGASAELMALLKRALAQRMGSSSGGATMKKRKKLKHKKAVKRGIKLKCSPAAVALRG